MGRQRVNPFDRGTAEWTLFEHYRRSKSTAEQLEQKAAMIMVDAGAYRSRAEHYAGALRSLGHGDKVTPLKALPNFAGSGS